MSIRVQRWGSIRRQELVGSKLSFSETSVLYYVRHGVTTSGVIAKRMQITARAVTGIVDRLEQAGLLARQHDEVDRRRIQLVLTTEGQDAIDFVEVDVLAPLIERIEKLDPAEREVLLRGMTILSDIMDDMGAANL